MKLALPFPRKRQAGPDRPLFARRRSRFAVAVIALIGLAVAAAGGLYGWRARVTGAAPTIAAPVTRGDLTVNVESGGTLKAARAIELSFESSGQVTEVLVKPGEQVKAGQPLARLADHEPRQQIKQAEADLKTAQARLAQARGGSTTPVEVAEATAGVRSAQAQLQQTRVGAAADLREAAAGVRSAQAQLDALRHPAPDQVSAGRLRLTQAQTALQIARDDLSAAKTNAEQDLAKAVATLTQAQSSYATALHDWQHVQERGSDPYSPTRTTQSGKTVPNTLNDAGRQKYRDAYVQAESALHAAEAAVRQAQVSYDAARQKEAAEVWQAEAVAADAQQQLDALLRASPSEIAQAQARVEQARARLDKLRRGGAAAEIAQAQARVDQARAGLDKLTAPADEGSIAIAQAGVDQAQAKLDAARRTLERATLVAPFDGTVALVSVDAGGAASAGKPAVTLVDMTAMRVDVDLSEADVAKVKPGQRASITFDALPDVTLDGTVESIAPMATGGQSVVTYLVRVTFDPGAAAVKLGMSASISIEVERHAQVLQVPSRAITSIGPMKSLHLRYGADNTPVTVQVQTGASNGAMTEIVSCVELGKQCLREGDQVLLTLPSGETSGGPGAGGDFQIAMPASGAAPAGPPHVIQFGTP